MHKNELQITSDDEKKNTCIICFSSRSVHKAELVRSLQKYKHTMDLYFYYDTNDLWYSKGIKGISNDADETVEYLKKITTPYKYVFCTGLSMGGYAAILYGSLLRAHYVLAFIPQTIINDYVDYKYSDVKPFINTDTNYLLIGNLNKKRGNYHHISQCERLQFNNVYTIRERFDNVKCLRENGYLTILFDIVFHKNIFIHSNTTINFGLLSVGCKLHTDRDYTIDKIPNFMIDRCYLIIQHKLPSNTTFNIVTMKKTHVYIVVHNIKHGGLLSSLPNQGWVIMHDSFQYDMFRGNHGHLTTILRYYLNENDAVDISTSHANACICIAF